MAGVLFQWEYRIEEWDKEGRSLEVWLLSTTSWAPKRHSTASLSATLHSAS